MSKPPNLGAYDGLSLDFLASTLKSGVEFASVWDERSPKRPETAGECLYAAIEHANRAVIEFLFERELVSVDTIRRTSLFHLTLKLCVHEQGEPIIRFLKHQGLDLTSPICAQPVWTLLDEAKLNGVSAHIAFVKAAMAD